MNQTTTPSRTLGFVTLFLIEMWERFGYYGMTAVVVLFMVQKLGYSDDRANLTFGAFTAMAYAVPAVGAEVVDDRLGDPQGSVRPHVEGHVVGPDALGAGFARRGPPGGASRDPDRAAT